MQHLRPTLARISLSNVRHNFRTLKSLQLSGGDFSSSFFCPMVKADAYGHGALEVAKAVMAEGAEHLGVATVEEGLELRQALGSQIRILTFAPLTLESVQAVIEAELTPVLSSWREIELVEKSLHAKAQFPVHLKFNTGMFRLGFPIQESDKLAKYFSTHAQFELQGVCTHLSDGEDAHNPQGQSAHQLKNFLSVTRAFQSKKIFHHALNSSALIARSTIETRLAPLGARTGISLYGVKPQLLEPSPVQLAKWHAIDLKPVLSLETKIVLTQSVDTGQAVSYNRRWTSEKNSTVGVLPIGYADGYHRRLSNVSRALVRGKSVPVVGTVCMDYTLIDATALGIESNDLYGESVILIGSQGSEAIHASELAELSGTNPYEILTSVSRRVPRVYE